VTTVIVTGGRDFHDEAFLLRALADLELKYGDVELIVQGGATGADYYARVIAEELGINLVTMMADWATHGRAAGPIRNRQMLESYPDAVVLAMPGGRGTDNCVRQALQRGMRVVDKRN
jgi:hypothetical protein